MDQIPVFHLEVSSHLEQTRVHDDKILFPENENPENGGLVSELDGLSEKGIVDSVYDSKYDIMEGNNQIDQCKYEGFNEFKAKAAVIIEEYFTTDEVESAVNELRDLGWPFYHYYFVKKLISFAMDRHDKEKEMAAILLSTLYSEVIEPQQVYKGFRELLLSSDDLSVDIPNVVDILSLFIARAVIDDILPPSFLTKHMDMLPNDSKGIDVIKKAYKGYLSGPLHAENILSKWGGSKNVTVENVKIRVNNLLKEYVVSGDRAEACRCIKDLKVPFFHHEIVKLALVLAMERRSCVELILNLLKEAAEEGVINSSQMSKGFSRLIDVIDDLTLDIPSAKKLLQSFISNASSEGWLCASSLKSISLQTEKKFLKDNDATRALKLKATNIIQEYFLVGDILEVVSSLDSQLKFNSPESHAIFVKRLIILAMGRKNREKEMGSVLLPCLRFPPEDTMAGFLLLLESAEDMALDHPSFMEDLAMFLARAVVDEAFPPSHLEEVSLDYPSFLGSKALQMAQSLLRAPLSSERILRCWGGGGTGKPGWEIADIKEKIVKLLEEYDSGGDAAEACRCIKDLGMPFFHHEVVKKALVTIMEKKKKKERLWDLLKQCFETGLITQNQMTKGFERVYDCLDDLVLDVPDIEKQYFHYVNCAKKEGWLVLSSNGGICDTMNLSCSYRTIG